MLTDGHSVETHVESAGQFQQWRGYVRLIGPRGVVVAENYACCAAQRDALKARYYRIAYDGGRDDSDAPA